MLKILNTFYFKATHRQHHIQSNLGLLGVGGDGNLSITLLWLILSPSSSSSFSSSNSSEDITMTPLSFDTSESSESKIIFIGLRSKLLQNPLLIHLLGGGLLGAFGNKSRSSLFQW